MSNRLFRMVAGGLALVSLGICLAAPLMYFLARISEGAYKRAFLLSSAAWFVLATAWAMAGKDRPSGG